MRRAFGRLCGSLLLATAIPGYAQSGQQTPTPAAAQPAALTGPLADDARSLFAPGWNSLEILGRLSSVSGDPARWQRYEDRRDGLLFTAARAQHETPEFSINASADNVGWRDQRFVGNFERIGRLNLTAAWDQIPQFYSGDTRTPFVSGGEGVLLLDDAAQRAANHNVYGGISRQFDLRERRDIGTVSLRATPTAALDVTGGFTTTKHSGERCWRFWNSRRCRRFSESRPSMSPPRWWTTSTPIG